MFGVVFIRRSGVINMDSFVQIDSTHWVLNLSALVGDLAGTARDVCLFVPGSGLLPADAGLSLHVSSPGSSCWEYRGYVSNAVLSDVFPTAWPQPAEGVACSSHAAYQVGVTLEPLELLEQRENKQVASKREFAKRVALDLYRYVVRPRGWPPVGRKRLARLRSLCPDLLACLAAAA
jgi:hypothetical protein